MEPFNLQKAKQWTADTRSGVLLGRKFVWTPTGQVASQGHVAILMPSGYVLQAAPFHTGGSALCYTAVLLLQAAGREGCHRAGFAASLRLLNKSDGDDPLPTARVLL
jgi:hypothetical protein